MKLGASGPDSPKTGLVIPRDHQGKDHGDRSSRNYHDYGSDAHEDPVLAQLPLPFLQGNIGPERGARRAGASVVVEVRNQSVNRTVIS